MIFSLVCARNHKPRLKRGGGGGGLNLLYLNYRKVGLKDRIFHWIAPKLESIITTFKVSSDPKFDILERVVGVFRVFV